MATSNQGDIMCQHCLSQLLESLSISPPKADPLAEKHQQERKELVEKQQKEIEESSLAPHQREGWLKTDRDIRYYDADTDLRDAILSLQAQIDELKESV